MRSHSDMQGNISYTFDDADLHKRIADYWTPERKAAALPAQGWQTEKQPGVSNPLPSATDPELADISQMPFAAGGKLFFSLNNEDYLATAEIVCQRNIVLTAAHCVQDKDSGALAENFLFERCYADGKSTESLTFRTVALKTYWHEQKRWKWDYAFAITNGLSSLTSPLGYSIQSPVGKELTAFGYPKNYYSGKRMVRVDGVAQAAENGTLKIQGDKMRKGSSGGAWLLKNTNTVVGINSYGPESEEVAYVGSSVFDADFDSLYRYVTTLL